MVFVLNVGLCLIEDVSNDMSIARHIRILMCWQSLARRRFCHDSVDDRLYKQINHNRACTVQKYFCMTCCSCGCRSTAMCRCVCVGGVWCLTAYSTPTVCRQIPKSFEGMRSGKAAGQMTAYPDIDSPGRNRSFSAKPHPPQELAMSWPFSPSLPAMLLLHIFNPLKLCYVALLLPFANSRE